MMDQLGTNGLTGEVDQHYWRLFGAIFIGGATRGQQMLQMEMAQAGGAGQIATGIAGLGNQPPRNASAAPWIRARRSKCSAGSRVRCCS